MILELWRPSKTNSVWSNHTVCYPQRSFSHVQVDTRGNIRSKHSIALKKWSKWSQSMFYYKRKVPAIQNFSTFCFWLKHTSFDSVFSADHEYDLTFLVWQNIFGEKRKIPSRGRNLQNRSSSRKMILLSLIHS